MQNIGVLGLILVITTIFGSIAARYKLPMVMGELIAGVLIGPGQLNWVQPNSFINYFSDVGVILLMFIAGLESNVQLLKRFIQPSIRVAVNGVLFPIILAFLTGKLFNLNNFESLFLGIIFAATSVSISVEVLKEMNQVNSNEGATILGAAVVDDILAVFCLSIVSSFSSNQPKTINQINFLNLGRDLLLFLGFFLIVFMISRWVIPLILKIRRSLLTSSSTTIISLIICFSLAYLAEITGLSATIGAFFAGIIIGQSEIENQITDKINLIAYSIFIPVFFVSIGIQMNLLQIWQDFSFFIVLTLSSIFSKLFGAGIGARISGFNWQSALIIGSGMVSRGEMALIIAQIGLKRHLLSAANFSIIVGVIIMTTIIAPELLKMTIQLAAKNKI